MTIDLLRIPSSVEKVTFNKAGAPDLQQAKPLSKQPMCKHMGDTDSCEGGDAGTVKNDFFNRTRYNSIRLLKLPFLASLLANFSTICSHMLSKFANKSAQKSSIFPSRASYARGLISRLIGFQKKAAFLMSLVLSTSTLIAEDRAIESLKNQVHEVLRVLPGWCSVEKADHFVDLVLEVKPQVSVEIGVFGGASAIPVALALKHLNAGVLYAIDPWDKWECIRDFDPASDAVHIEWWSRVGLNQIYLNYKSTIKQLQLEKACITLKMTAEKGADKIESIDILYIDGNHSERCSVQDVELYLPKVRSNGYIWVNDTACAGTLKAISILLEACDFVKSIDNGNCILLRKR